MKNFAVLALGSNLGDRLINLSASIKYLKEIGKIKKISSIYKTEALLPHDSPKEWDEYFLNCVLEIKTDLSAQELLFKTQEIEKIINIIPRNKGTSAPRMLDVDILVFNEEIIENETLIIPHARMCERNFVMYPVAEILPDWRYYGVGNLNGKTALQISKILPNIEKFCEIEI